MVNVCSTRRRRGQKTTKIQVRPICRSRRPQLQAQRARRVEWSPAGAGRETLGVPLGTCSTVGGGDSARSSSEEEEGQEVTRKLEGQTGKRVLWSSPCHSTSVCRTHRWTSDDGTYWNWRPPTHTAVDQRTRHSSGMKRGPVVRAGADVTLPVTAPKPGAEGQSRTPRRMQEQSCLPSPQPLPGKQIPPGSRKTW